MSKNVTKGMFRVWIVLTILWVGGMSWYQYKDAQKYKDSGITIALSKESQFRIDEKGISKNTQSDRDNLQMKRMAMIFIPPLLLLIMFPVGVWMTRGFKG
ncbi:MAG: hypothetical protein R3D71_09060 [Rickettsiales bacterium]